MAFDGIAVSAIAVELNEKLGNARVARIYQPSRHTIIIHLRSIGQTHKLLISADPESARIHTTKVPDPNPEYPPAFCMLLRKHLEPSRLIGIEQVEFERIVAIRFETYDLDLNPAQKSIVCELMGRNSNIILINQDQTILDAIHRNNDPNHPRPIMPGLRYQLPPVHKKINPRSSSKTEFAEELRLLPASTSLAQALVERYQGLGPQAAMEVCSRSALDPELGIRDLTIDQMHRIWQALVELTSGKYQPTMICSPKPDFFAYMPVKAPSNGRVRQFAEFDELLDHFYTSMNLKRQLQQKTAKLQRMVNTHLKRIRRKEQIHRDTVRIAAGADTWQKWGEIILANIYQIKKGDDKLEAVDFYQPGQPKVIIELDPRLSPSENAQHYFNKYTKAKRGAKNAVKQLEETTLLRSYLEEISIQLEQADDLETTAEIEAELIKEGLIAKTDGWRRKTAGQTREKRPKPYDQYRLLTEQ